MKVTLNKHMLVAMGLPKELWHCSIGGISDENRTYVSRYLDNLDKAFETGAGLFLFGSTGTGKSGIASVVAKEFRQHCHTVTFLTVPDLRELIRSREEYSEGQGYLNRCKQVQLLVIDDLTVDGANDFTFGLRHLRDLLLHRKSRLLNTIITTQINLRDCPSEMDDIVTAAYDCLVPLNVKGPDLRKNRKDAISSLVYGDK